MAACDEAGTRRPCHMFFGMVSGHRAPRDPFGGAPLSAAPRVPRRALPDECGTCVLCGACHNCPGQNAAARGRTASPDRGLCQISQAEASMQAAFLAERLARGALALPEREEMAALTAIAAAAKAHGIDLGPRPARGCPDTATKRRRGPAAGGSDRRDKGGGTMNALSTIAERLAFLTEARVASGCGVQSMGCCGRTDGSWRCNSR